MPSDIRDPSLASDGKTQIALAELGMSALVEQGRRFAEEKPFAGLRIAVNLHVTKETAVLVRALAAGGAERIALTGCNAFSTQDNIAAALAAEGIDVYAKHGCSKDDFYVALGKALDIKPHLIVDDGCDLTVEMHKRGADELGNVIGGCEQTTSGVIRATNMTADGALKYPLIATNDNKTKHLLDNYYGTGQSVVDSVMRATAMFLPSKVAVVVGYGACGKGIALRAKGLGARVVVTETHPFAALQAVYDGFQVVPMAEAAALGDLFISATGSKHVVSAAHMANMKDGAVVCNAGQFDYEIDLTGLRAMQVGESRLVRPTMEEVTLKNGRRINLLGGGNLVNLSCAEGHPSEVMATSFMGQALACEYLVKHGRELAAGCMKLPEELDNRIAALQLNALGIAIDVPTAEQEEYAKAWMEGVQ